ncbi:MAG: S9 family peptidase, partial [Gammaproteobacteria bacterium]|nr:S9 family peptidase [Gammaproteobacteria bacterium]
MKRPLIALVIVLLAGAAVAKGNTQTHPFNATDLAMMDRVSDPQLSPHGFRAAFAVAETDWAANKRVSSIWILNLDRSDATP